MMVGDSATDIEAAHAVGAMAAGYANKPGKAERFRALGCDLVIHSMDELATALKN
ncbi:HAD hydrolase-like protein [Nocardiopsis sp. LOL_012]|uniref:HAD hydrolase-like protein n=1 Tax=Nocardiopsis sp. LOL_012 TaxID=3345409 RepID=UPI003A851C46